MRKVEVKRTKAKLIFKVRRISTHLTLTLTFLTCQALKHLKRSLSLRQ